MMKASSVYNFFSWPSKIREEEYISYFLLCKSFSTLSLDMIIPKDEHFGVGWQVAARASIPAKALFLFAALELVCFLDGG